MANSVAAFIAAIKGEVSNPAHTKVDSQLRFALKHALSRVSPERVAWSEAAFSFLSAVGVHTYSSSTANFPRDAREFEVVEVQSNATANSYEEVRPATLLEIRSLLRSAQGNATAYPDRYAWFAEQLVFSQAFSGVVSVRGDYRRDARRDLGTGNLIDETSASDAYVNPWLTQGEDPLWAKTLEIYHARFAVDAERAVYYQRQYEWAMKSLRAEWADKATAGMRVEGYLGGGEEAW